MGVPCSQDCKHRLNAEMDVNQLEPSWRVAFEKYEFTVPKAERCWFRCNNQACDGNLRNNWRKLNVDNPPEFNKCLSCGIQLKRLKKEEEEVQENRQQSSQQLPVSGSRTASRCFALSSMFTPSSSPLFMRTTVLFKDTLEPF